MNPSCQSVITLLNNLKQIVLLERKVNYSRLHLIGPPVNRASFGRTGIVPGLINRVKWSY